MGRFFDFAKRRVVGYIVFWILILLFLGVFYQGNQPAQVGGIAVLGLAFVGSLLYTRRMKRKQRVRREADQLAKQMHKAYRMQPTAQVPRAPQVGPAPPAQPVQPPPRTGGR